MSVASHARGSRSTCRRASLKLHKWFFWCWRVTGAACLEPVVLVIAARKGIRSLITRARIERSAKQHQHKQKTKEARSTAAALSWRFSIGNVESFSCTSAAGGSCGAGNAMREAGTKLRFRGTVPLPDLRCINWLRFRRDRWFEIFEPLIRAADSFADAHHHDSQVVFGATFVAALLQLIAKLLRDRR